MKATRRNNWDNATLTEAGDSELPVVKYGLYRTPGTAKLKSVVEAALELKMELAEKTETLKALHEEITDEIKKMGFLGRDEGSAKIELYGAEIGITIKDDVKITDIDLLRKELGILCAVLVREKVTYHPEPKLRDLDLGDMDLVRAVLPALTIKSDVVTVSYKFPKAT